MSELKSIIYAAPPIVSSESIQSEKPNDTFGLDRIAQRGNAHLCLQCHKCVSGCPASAEMDFPPSQIVRLVQLGQKETLLGSRSIWLCTSCHACSTRCPAGVSPTALQDGLRHLSTAEGRLPSDPRAAQAAEAFLWSVQKSGRTHELSIARRFKLRTKTYFEMFFLGITMILRGKLKLFGKKIRRPKTIATLVRAYVQRRPSKD